MNHFPERLLGLNTKASAVSQPREGLSEIASPGKIDKFQMKRRPECQLKQRVSCQAAFSSLLLYLSLLHNPQTKQADLTTRNSLGSVSREFFKLSSYLHSLKVHTVVAKSSRNNFKLFWSQAEEHVK